MALVVLVAVTAGGCSHRSPQGSAGIGPAAPEVSAGASVAPIGSTPSETTAPTATATPPSTPTPTQTTAAPKVTHVALTVDAATVKNVNCMHTYMFSGTISVSRGPVTVNYAWKQSNSQVVTTGSVHFGPGGAQHATVHRPMGVSSTSLDTSERTWMNFSVTGPNAMAAPNANVFLDCVPATQDLKVNVTAGPGACGGHVTTMSFGVIGFPNVTVPYTIQWGDGTHQTGTTTTVPPARSSTINSHHTYAAGKYTVHIWAGVSGDSGISGDSQSFSFTCS